MDKENSLRSVDSVKLGPFLPILAILLYAIAICSAIICTRCIKIYNKPNLPDGPVSGIKAHVDKYSVNIFSLLSKAKASAID
jgi:hypothetical protein